MIATVTKLSTAATSYYEVKRQKSGWSVTLVTPSGYGKSLRTKLCEYAEGEGAVRHAEESGAKTFRPVKVSGGCHDRLS